MSSLPTNTPSVIQVSEHSFAVFGIQTASNPLGFCHVKKEKKTKSGYCCSGKDCRSFSSKAKGSAVKAYCLQLHLLLASLQQFAAHETNSFSAGPSSIQEPATSPTLITEEISLQRQSTVLLADKTRKLPYHIPRELL